MLRRTMSRAQIAVCLVMTASVIAVSACSNPSEPSAARSKKDTGAIGKAADPSLSPSAPGSKSGSATKTTTTNRPSQSLNSGVAKNVAPTGCRSRISQAKNPQEYDAAVAACGDSKFPSGSSRPVSQDSHYESLTWAEALRWWPSHLLLRAPKAPPSSTESVFALSDSGGRSESPANGSAGVVVFYDTPENSVANSDVLQIVAGGGTCIAAMTVRAAEPFQPPADSKVVQVRGKVGHLWSLNYEEKPVRFTKWTTSSGDVMLVFTSDQLSDDEAIEYIDALVEVRQ